MRKFKFKQPTEADILQDKELAKKFKFRGVKPSADDDRDFVACITSESTNFPKEYLSNATDVLNQGSIGSCVAHACASALSQSEETQIKKHNNFSRGYIYGNRREADHQDEGMIIREALKNLNHCGDVLYDDFPYNLVYPRVKKLINDDKENLSKKAFAHRVTEYSRCYSESQIKNAIINNGSVIICVPVYKNFGRDLHKPSDKDKCTGYHAMIIVGWTKDNRWVVQNSWGATWGYGGKLLMDSDYPVNEYWTLSVDITNNTDDMFEKDSSIEKILNWVRNLFKNIFAFLK